MLTMAKKINFFLAMLNKKSVFILITIIFFQAIVETVSISSILPFLAVVGAPQLVETNKILAGLYAITPVETVNQFMIFLGGIFFCVIAAGNIFASFSIWYFLRFSMFCGYRLSTELFKRYLAQSYPFFVEKNSSFLISNIISEVSRVVLGIVINLLQLLNKCIIVSFILALLIIIDGKLALSVMTVLGGAYISAFWIIRGRLQKAGETSSYCNTHRYRAVSEAFAVIKELKLLGREAYFLSQFEKYSKEYSESETKSQILPQVSRYFIEIIAFGGILLIVLYLLYTQQDLHQALPLLGLYALAGYRLMPALQQIFAGVSTMRYHSHALDIIIDEFKRPVPLVEPHQKALSFEKKIVFNQVAFQYRGADRFALQSVDLKITKNSSIGIVGASGAGKTTLVDLLLGLFLPTQGHIMIDDITLEQGNLVAWRSCVGYVPQMIRLIDSSIRKNIALGIAEEAIENERVYQVARMTGIADFIEGLPHGYDTLVGEEGTKLSGGQKQRIGIARALYHDPQILVLDEATSALDGFSEQLIVETLKQLAMKKTIIIIAHRLSTVKHCEEIVLMAEGKVADRGHYDALVERNRYFSDLAISINN